MTESSFPAPAAGDTNAGQAFRPAFDMPTTPEQALAMLVAWADPSCATFDHRKAAAAAALLSVRWPEGEGEAVAWAYVREGKVRGLGFERDADAGLSIPLTFAAAAVVTGSSRPDGVTIAQTAMHKLSTVIRTLERDGDEHGVAEDLHRVGADFDQVTNILRGLEATQGPHGAQAPGDQSS